MKNHFIHLVMLLLSLFAYSQNNISYGLKAGINFTYANGDAEDIFFIDNVEGRVSFHAGIISEVSLSERFSIQPELVYSQVGAKYYYDPAAINGQEIKSDLNLDYITLPLLAKYYVYKRLSIEIGPQLGYILSAKIKNEGSTDVITSGNLEIDINQTIDIKGDINNFDLGLVFGAGYELDTSLLFQARLVLGLSEIPKNNSNQTLNDFRNIVFQISLGYKF